MHARDGAASRKRLFQFQDGSIKCSPSKYHHPNFASFNSKMVRLNELIRSSCSPSKDRFNSKMVRLNAILWGKQNYRHRGFNSKMVRLNDIERISIGGAAGVSIPRWFD